MASPDVKQVASQRFPEIIAASALPFRSPRATGPTLRETTTGIAQGRWGGWTLSEAERSGGGDGDGASAPGMYRLTRARPAIFSACSIFISNPPILARTDI